jgi:hypothetical protein
MKLRVVIATQSIVYHPIRPDDGNKLLRSQYYLARNLLLVGHLHLPVTARWAFYLWHLLFRFIIAVRWWLVGKIDVGNAIIKGLVEGISMVAQRVAVI